MFGTLGGPELFLIFVVALIVFGPRKLPEIGKSLGKMMSEFRRASNDFRSTIESEVESEKIRESMRIEPPKVEKVKKATPADSGTGSDGKDGATTEGTTSSEGSPEPAGPPTAYEPPATAEPAPNTDPDGEPVPSTVSRQPPAADEPK